LQGWMEALSINFKATLESRRYRTGRRLAHSVKFLSFRKSKPSVIEHMNEIFKKYEEYAGIRIGSQF
jgi:hypothetical protein